MSRELSLQVKLHESLNWSEVQISELLFHNLPRGWEEFFESVSEILALISRKLSASPRRCLPSPSCLFDAFYLTCAPKVVIVGQDPYYKPELASGIPFRGAGKSLNNILRKLKQEGYRAENRDLKQWTTRGVLLLNMALTVEENRAGSHLGLWKPFTQALLRYLQSSPEIVYILWGKKAQSLTPLIHGHILAGGHPSPNNTDRSFFLPSYFQASNQFLLSKKISPVDWNLYPSESKDSEL
jgi:uracil-DNA glycosylase